MPWINSREAGLGRGDGVALVLLVFPPAFFLLPTEVFLPFVFFSAASFFGATFLAALGLAMAFCGLAEREAAALDRVLPFFAVCVGVAIM